MESVFQYIVGLQPVDPELLEEYEREMEEETIPAIIEAVQRREVLAHESRQRGPLFGHELQPGECGGTSCPPEYEERLGTDLGTRELFSRPDKVHPNRECGGGRRVLRSTKSLT